MKTQFEPTIKLVFKFYTEFSIPFDVTPQDTLVEVRQYLTEASPLFLFANFHFEVNGKRVNEYQDIAQNQIQDGSIVNILIDEFDERSARFHVKKVHEALAQPGLLQLLYEKPQKPGEKEDFPFNSNVQKILSYEEPQESKSESPSSPSTTLQLSDVLNAELVPSLLLDQSRARTAKLINSLTYSGYNPPNHNQRMRGDLFYLTLRTLENSEYHITASPMGFFVNKSTMKVFDPEHHSACYHALTELFRDMSPLFKKELQLLTKETIPQQVQLLSSLRYNHQWLVRKEANEQQWDAMKNETWALNLYGLDITSVRDWNEELQVFRDLPRTDFIQKINRDKALVKVHGDFLDAAIKGAMAVVDKIIQPLNPMDTELQQVYVYNHIFFSYAMETPENFRQESGMDATPTVSTTNCDFRNLKLLHRLEIPDLHLLNAALVDYKGRRVIAQSIIPGILNSDHSNCTQYGSIDEGKTIQKSPQFHTLMSKVCEYFHLDDQIEFLDQADQVFEMAVGIEVKGILGSDKRMYLLDLLRLSPRDLNYADDALHQCCVLRPELVQNFYVQSAFEKLKGVNEAKEQLSRIQRILQGSDKSNLKLNAAISTNVRLKDSEKIIEQRKELQVLAEYLRKQAIVQLVQDLKQPDRMNQDTVSLSELFHAHGVNMRYLGEVASQIDAAEFPGTIMQLERAILCKSLKHVFRQAMRETSPTYMSETLAHLLNTVFASMAQRLALDGSDQQQQTVNVDKKKKKKKKKSLQTGVANTNTMVSKSLITPSRPEFLTLTPREVWRRMTVIARARYSHVFPEQYESYSWMKFTFFRISCLRELCQLIGLKIVCCDYDLNEPSKLPFESSHIAQIEPVVKCIEVQSEDERLNLDLGYKFFHENKIQESLECYLTAAQIIMNLYGTVHRDLAVCFSKISAIYYKKAEFETAIQFQRQAVSINIHIYGMDNLLTANSLTNLSFYYFGMKRGKEAFNCMLHALYLYSVVGGESHQDVFNQFTNLSLLYSESGQHQAAINCLFEALDRCENLHKGNHSNSMVKIAGYYQAIALEHSELGDVQKAVEFQNRAVGLITQVFGPNDPRAKDSNKLLENLNKALQEKKKNANNVAEGTIASLNKLAPKRAFGTNRPKHTEPMEQESEPGQVQDSKEREELLMRLRQAKVNAKHGFRRQQPGYDINRLMQEQYRKE